MKKKINSSSELEIITHLKICDNSFTPPLSTYVNIKEYSKKINEKSTRFEIIHENNLIALLCAYENKDEKTVFVTNVSVIPYFQNRGISYELINFCIDFYTVNKFEKIVLEVYNKNKKALNFYKKNKFDIIKYGEKVTMELTLKRNYNEEIKDTKDHKYSYDFDFDIMHPYMIETMKPFFKGSNVMELGSFKGDFTRHLLPLFNNITCVDASDESIKIAKDNLPSHVEFIHSTFEDLSIDNKYQNILLTHVLEHIDDRIGLLEKIKNNWVTDDGLIFIVCPNANAASRQIAVKMGLIDKVSDVTESEKKHGHRITYSLDTLENDVKKSGLKVVHKGGIFFKSLANFQWDEVINKKIVSKEYLDGCFMLGHHYPELCSSVIVICKKD